MAFITAGLCPTVIHGDEVERPIELFKWVKTTVEGKAALEPPKSVKGKPISVDWLKAASLAYNISDDPRDFVIETVPSVTADVPNRNTDCFPLAELVKFNPQVGRVAYKTFVGKPTHVNHENQDPLKAKGVNFDALMRVTRSRLHNTRVRTVFVLSGFDRTKDPDLVREILGGDSKAYSMGAMATLLCSVCSKHIKQCSCSGQALGSIINGQLRYRICTDINFIENSKVKIGANPESLGYGMLWTSPRWRK